MEFKQIRLKDYRGKYLVLIFYPLDFTFVCPTEITAFSDAYQQFQAINCEVVAVSTDSHYSHMAWISTPRREGGLGPTRLPLLGDKSAKVTMAYGVYNEELGVPYRGLFIVDDKQRLRQITINDMAVGRSVAETLRLVQAFQHSDKHGEGCPADWHPGQTCIVADPDGSKAYFRAMGNKSQTQVQLDVRSKERCSN